MKFKSLLLSVVIILLAFECCEGSKARNDMFLQNDAKFLVGRKMLQVVDDTTPHISGVRKRADLPNTLDPQSTLGVVKENDASDAADEVANLMQRDYRGVARRRPPIHNRRTNN